MNDVKKVVMNEVNNNIIKEVFRDTADNIYKRGETCNNDLSHEQTKRRNFDCACL